MTGPLIQIRKNVNVSKVCGLGLAVALAGAVLPAWGQTMPEAGTMPAARTTTLSGSITLTTPAPATAPAEFQGFVGVIGSDRVYVRSGPGVNFYELGQLGKGDLVEVTGQRQGWYQIAPPAGTYCYVAKEYVEADAGGTTGVIKGTNYVNVRAASALHPVMDYAILTAVAPGTKLTIVGGGGANDKYYKVAPPTKASVYVSPQFVHAAPAGTAYVAAALRLPNGVSGPKVPAGGAAAASTEPVVHGAASAVTDKTTEPGMAPLENYTGTGAAATGSATTEPERIVVRPQPTTMYSEDAYTQFGALNTKLRAEFDKPIGQRDLDGILKDYKALLDTPNVPPSVKQGSEARINAIEKNQALQNLMKAGDVSGDTAFEEQRKGYEQQWEAAKKAVEEAEKNGPMLAEGRLQTSTVVASKYVLVNPVTGRVTAYLEPSSEIDLSKLLGEYIGVRGSTDQAEGTAVKVIRVKNATLMAGPGKAER